MPTSDEVDLSYAFGLAPEAAVEYLRAKGYAISPAWEDVWQEAQAKAFTVAGVMKMDVLQDIRNLVQSAIDNGDSFGTFQQGMLRDLAAKGWGSDGVDLATMGVAEPWRLKTIYQTNLQTAYMAGRYKTMMANVDNAPFWQYVAVLDSRTRPAHAALNGMIFRFDDPFWDTHYPPLGFNCRCRIIALNGADVAAWVASGGFGVTSSEGRMSWEDRIVSTKTGEIQKVAVYNDPLTGMKIATDPGWSYNPGRVAFTPDLTKYDPAIAKQYLRTI